MKLLDTDVLIDLFHGSQVALNYLTSQVTGGETLIISVITVTEILSGLRSGEEERTDKLLNLFAIQDIDEGIGRQAGAYLRQYRRTHNLELGDALIAATALSVNAELIHLSSLPGPPCCGPFR